MTLGRALLFMVGCAVILMIVSPHAPRLAGPWSQATVGLEASLATLALTLAFVRWDGIQPADIGAAPRRASIGRLLLGFAIGLLLVAAQSGLFATVAHVRWVRSDVSGYTPMLSALAAYLLLASREELAFRGYPLRRLGRSLGLWAAQFIVATVYALEHRAGGYSWTNALFGAFVGSLLFGMAALATRGLALPIGLHAAWNFGQWIIGEKEMPGPWEPVIAGGPSAHADHVALMAYVVVFGAATLAFWGYRRTSLGT
jgi:membrane protease YdiL (CAAX protease family)